MFKKILIANRGEIAVRIMATCREMGIQTVAIYSETDWRAQHVLAADEAYLIGPAPATQSYLRSEKIIAVAQQCGAEALHPGYGFLSEHAQFAEACTAAGIVFIGPPASAMRLMGSKIAAKQLAQSLGAPIVPGYNGASQDEASLLHEAQRMGFPLLIKASAGGGGKGMREVYTATDFLEQLAGARREAKSAFGDDTVLLERLISQPRHVEIQILADTYGNMIHLGERDCSIQRRHQKIIEESPCVALTPELRSTMAATAIRIAQAAGYVNAGTVEFLLDTDQRYYFLEMNTRLQVEHPVTELVTGLDLVRHQIRIAAGEPLGVAQEQIQLRGHAIEARIYAEDPQQNFLPSFQSSTGIISHFIKPEGPGIRVDSGIASGDEITHFYDPLIAKIIVYGESRSVAIERLQAALKRTIILGVFQSLPQLLQMLSFQTPPSSCQTLPHEILQAAALYETLYTPLPDSASTNGQHPWRTLGPWRMIGETRIITYTYQQQSYKIALKPVLHQENSWQIQIDTHPSSTVTASIINDACIILKNDASQIQLYVARQHNEVQVIWNGESYRLERRQLPNIAGTAQGHHTIHMQKMLTSPMAGTIVKVQVHAGEYVQAQQVLIVLSAMKMEHAITASHEGKIRHVYYEEGAVVPGGALLIEME
ncbi:MAG: acetyl-CoA carboxylase biotin carboxylase subunit [Chloroflexi bacterium]|nr:MAG: acetyl-CoA carboxylase biotin carboxylase subunit [Chloroflexota bacterium]